MARSKMKWKELCNEIERAIHFEAEYSKRMYAETNKVNYLTEFNTYNVILDKIKNLQEKMVEN